MKSTRKTPAPRGKTPARTPPGRPKDTAKRESIVRAANTLFMKDGYTLTSMEAVARKAGVSKLTIYSHFANKDELFKEVIHQRCDKLAMPDSFMALAREPAEKALLKLGFNLASLIFRPDSIHLHRIMQAEAAHHPKIVQIFFETGPRRVRAAFGSLLREWHDQKQLAIPDIAKATDQFFSLLKGELLLRVILLRMPMPSEDELKAHVRETVRFFLAAYQLRGRGKA